MRIIERISALCKENGTTVTNLEKELGYSNGSLAKAKDIPSSRILDIAIRFNVSTDFILTGNDSRVETPKFENCEFFVKSKYSHIIMLSSNNARDVESMFVGFNLSLSLMSIVCVDYEKGELPVTDNTRFIPVVPGAEDKCLHGIKF
jgi:hypothetical protein